MNPTELTKAWVGANLGATVVLHGREWMVSGHRAAAVVLENEDERTCAVALASAIRLMEGARHAV